MTIKIKLILAVLLLLCLLDMPYWYYQFVRLAAFAGFGFLAYSAYNDKKQTEAIIYAGLALLFQPFVKIALGRDGWNLVDLAAGAGLIISAAVEYRRGKTAEIKRDAPLSDKNDAV